MNTENKFKQKVIKTVTENKKNLLSGSLLKEEYFKLFKKMEQPTNQQEIFKNTPLDVFENFDYDLYDKDYDSFQNADYSKYMLKHINKCNLIVLVNGFFSPEHSNIISENIEISKLSEKVKNDYFAIEKYYITYSERHENILSTLNAAIFRDGVFLNIKKDAVIEEPIHILSVFTEQENNCLFNQRLLVVADENSQATIIENVFSESNTKIMMVQVAELHQSKNSKIDYYRLNNYAETNGNLIVFLNNEFTVEESAVLNRFSVNFNSIFSRNRTNAKIIGKNASVNFNSFAYIKGNGFTDIRTIIEVAAPESRCNQHIKTIAAENARVIFNGKIKIEHCAQKVEAHQKTRAILLDDSAEFFCEPQLEIYADDVICSHGAAIGSIDEELMFYLKSRAIGNDEARKLLITAFAGEIFDKIHIPELRHNLIEEFQTHIACDN